MKPVCLRGEALPEAEIGEMIGDSLMASPGFASVWAAHGGRRAVWVYRMEGRIAAALPGIEFGCWPVRRFLAMPNGLYGRLFVRNEFKDRTALIGGDMLAGILSTGYVKTYIFDFFMDSLPETDAYDLKGERALLVAIGDASWEPPDRKLRGEIRRAEREGLTVRRIDWSADRAAFLGLVKQMHAEHHLEERYRESFWQALAALAAADDRVRWYLAEFEGDAVSSHIYFVEGDLLIGWQMYYDRGFSTLKANPYLIWHACCEGRSRGVRTLDLGATPEGLSGTEFFKKRWGGYEHAYRELSKRRWLGRLR